MRCFNLMTIAVLSLSLQNCKSTGHGAGQLEATNGGFKKLSGNITTSDIRAHDAALQAKGKIPAGDYTIRVSGITWDKGYLQECQDLLKVKSSNADPTGIRARYAGILGFEECRAAPSTTAKQMVFNCTKPKLDSVNIRYITLILNTDYEPYTEGGLGQPCHAAFEEITKIDGRTPDVSLKDDNIWLFSGVSKFNEKIEGCRIAATLR